jgi:DNA polymerase-4
MAIVDRVTRRLRGAHRVGRTVVLRLRFDDFTRATRSCTLAEPTADTEPILAAARHLLDAAGPLIEARGITLIGLSIANLDDDRAVQLLLPFGARSRAALDVALDSVRERYGASSVKRATLVNRDEGWSMPMLPD